MYGLVIANDRLSDASDLLVTAQGKGDLIAATSPTNWVNLTGGSVARNMIQGDPSQPTGMFWTSTPRVESLGLGPAISGEAPDLDVNLSGDILVAPAVGRESIFSGNVKCTGDFLTWSGSNYLGLAASEALTAPRTLTFVVGDANRTLTLSGDPTLGNWFDQDLRVAASPEFAGLTLTGVSGVLVATAGAVAGQAGSNDLVDFATSTPTKATLLSAQDAGTWANVPPPGGDDEFLTSDASEATGVKWVTSSPGGGSSTWVGLTDTVGALEANRFVRGNALADTLVFYDLLAEANVWTGRNRYALAPAGIELGDSQVYIESPSDGRMQLFADTWINCTIQGPTNLTQFQVAEDQILNNVVGTFRVISEIVDIDASTIVQITSQDIVAITGSAVVITETGGGLSAVTGDDKPSGNAPDMIVRGADTATLGIGGILTVQGGSGNTGGDLIFKPGLTIGGGSDGRVRVAGVFPLYFGDDQEVRIQRGPANELVSTADSFQLIAGGVTLGIGGATDSTLR